MRKSAANMVGVVGES